MKKTFVVILLAVAALAIVTTGVVMAQTPQPPVPGTGNGMPFGFGRGRMGGFGGDGEFGPMHDYMEKAMAQALGISVDEFETRRAAGETAYQIALSEGIAADKIPALLSGARSKALDEAAAAGVITQAQADWMKSRATQMGNGNCMGGGQSFGPGMRGGWRFQQNNP